jgi:signal transduction histidine kinase
VSNGRNEFDRLAGNLNQMLDTVEARMEDMRQLSNNIAHDLRTPLTRLRGLLDHIQANGSGYENATKQIDQILATFDALLRISHLEAGTARILRQQMDLRVLATDIVDLYTPLADQKRQQLTTQVSVGQITADKDLIFQALANLTENAVKYAPEGINIQISARKQDGNLSLSVINEGEGIAREMLEKTTERFVRADPARQEAGVGLGLALVRAIAEAHDGKLVLMNLADGFEARLNLPLPG